MILPLARNTDIIVQEAGQELLLYDLVTHKAYNLNETSKIVYQNCDGKLSFDALKSKHKFTDDLIYFALDELQKRNLLEDETYLSPLAGLSRRQVIRRIGLASMVVLPVVAGLIAPTAISALSNCSGTNIVAPGDAAACAAPGSPLSCPNEASTFCCSRTGTAVTASPSSFALCHLFTQPTIQVCVCS